VVLFRPVSAIWVSEGVSAVDDRVGIADLRAPEVPGLWSREVSAHHGRTYVAARGRRLGFGETFQQRSPSCGDLVEVLLCDRAFVTAGDGAGGYSALASGALWGVLRRFGRLVVVRSWWCGSRRRVRDSDLE